MSQWQVVSFRAWQDGRYVGLAEILIILGRFGLPLEWRCFVDEVAPEPGREQMEDLDRGAALTTLALMALVAPDLQVIDGRFDGYRHGELAARIRAVDSSDWDIEAADVDILQQFVAEYPRVLGPSSPEQIGS